MEKVGIVVSLSSCHFRLNLSDVQPRMNVCETMSESDSGFGGGVAGVGIDIDPAFASIPKGKACLCIWRVEVC